MVRPRPDAPYGGNWHVGAESDPCERATGQTAFRVRLTPPLDARLDAVEVVVTGPVTRVGAVVPVRDASAMPET